MKNLILVLLMIIHLTACASVKSTGKSMAEDLGSPEKIELLKQRADDFWTAFIEEDYEALYDLYDPFFKIRTNKYSFMGTLGRIKYHEYEIEDISVEGNVALVKVSVIYSMPKVMLKLREFSVPKSPRIFTERWLYIYDNWYKEYYNYAVEMGVVEY